MDDPSLSVPPCVHPTKTICGDLMFFKLPLFPSHPRSFESEAQSTCNRRIGVKSKQSSKIENSYNLL